MEESQASERLEGATCGTGGPRSSSRRKARLHATDTRLHACKRGHCMAGSPAVSLLPLITSKAVHHVA
jgi:hypothetical protein